MCNSDFRAHLKRGIHPLTTTIDTLNGRSFTAEMAKLPPVKALFDMWAELASEPFTGITADGTVEPSLYSDALWGAPVEAMTLAADALLAVLNEDQRTLVVQPLEAPEWRSWHNTEMVLHRHGLRLEYLDTSVREAIFGVLRASLSRTGFERIRSGMRTNQFLGDCLGYPNILGEFSYTFCLFGAPAMDKAWGWQFFGHHIALTCLVIGDRMVLGPIFYGAEPTAIDEGPHAGLRLFTEEEATALALMRGLSDVQQAEARLPTTMATADLAPSPGFVPEQRHLSGAFRDNRVIPYAGTRVADFDAAARKRLLAIIDCYIAWYPDDAREARREEITAQLDRTHFAWIGGSGDVDPFYYRIHSPVLLIEFDHHFGAHLANTEPARFHIHTITRLPNGNDYGRLLVSGSGIPAFD